MLLYLTVHVTREGYNIGIFTLRKNMTICPGEYIQLFEPLKSISDFLTKKS